MNDSSTTRSRPGRCSRASSSRASSVPVGFSGLPRTTASASSGTSAGSSRQDSGSRRTRTTSLPAARNAASGSVKPGWTQATSRGRSAAASSQNASQAPFSSSTSSGARPWRAAAAALAARVSGYAGLGECRVQRPLEVGGPRARPHVDREVERARREQRVAVDAQAQRRLPATIAQSARALHSTIRESLTARAMSSTSGGRPSPRNGRCSRRPPYRFAPPSLTPSAPANAASARPAFGLGCAPPSRRSVRSALCGAAARPRVRPRPRGTP